jgi:hypothetical protein
MSFSRKRQQQYWPFIALAVGATATAYAVYQYFQKPALEELDSSSSHQLEASIKYTNKPITIILTESILSSQIPLVEILNKTENIVLVITPDLSLADLPNVNESITYKIIECDTSEGVWSVVKHLRSEIVLVVSDDLDKSIPEDVGRYVQEIVELDQNNTEINVTILSYIIT